MVRPPWWWMHARGAGWRAAGLFKDGVVEHDFGTPPFPLSHISLLPIVSV